MRTVFNGETFELDEEGGLWHCHPFDGDLHGGDPGLMEWVFGGALECSGEGSPGCKARFTNRADRDVWFLVDLSQKYRELLSNLFEDATDDERDWALGDLEGALGDKELWELIFKGPTWSELYEAKQSLKDQG